MDNGGFQLTKEGTPQGGVISPLLANIALHGMENRIKQAFPEKYFRKEGKFGKFASPNFIRYADDFVILHENLEVIQKCQQIIAEWLKDIGLELKPSKTRITHTLNNGENKPGFDFLGFNIRQFKVNPTKGAKNARGQQLGIITLTSPSKESLSRHIKNLAETVDRYSTAPQEVIISNLNPKIRGWSNYYSIGASKSTFQKADFLLYQKLRGWALRRCAGTNKTDTNRKYWRKFENQNWCFSTHEGVRLVTHSEKPIERFIKVKGTRSPYDGDWVYWGTRMGNNPDTPKRVTTLLKRQKGKCLHCGGNFKYGDLMEVDHISPKSKGGKDAYANMQLLHRHCHDIKSTLDSTHDKSQYVEEPDE
jgi:RNA-directed DNA polymerase